MLGRFIRLTLQESPQSRERSRLLERLLTNARCVRTNDWRDEAYAAIAPGRGRPALAPARLAARGVQADGYALLATPVHYLAELRNVRLPAEGLLDFSAEEAQALATDFARVWRDAPVRLIATGAVLCCLFEGSLEVKTQDPTRALGRHVDGFVPAGKDAARLRALASEIEMWLFDHALNRARGAGEGRTVNGLWLWGGGHAPITLPVPDGGAYGEDVFFELFKVPSLPEAQVLVSESVPGTADWSTLETEWLAPAALALRQGRAASLTISLGDRLWQVHAGRRLNFWRRTRPWWQSLFDAPDD